jgi:hypothetical protein
MIGFGAAVATGLTGLGLAIGLKGESEPQQAQPAASAGLAPGEGAAGSITPTSPEASVPPQEAETVDMNDWTIENFEYNLEGKTITGVAELEAAYGIRVEDNPTGEDAAKQLIKNVIIWINSLDTEKDKEIYAAYSPLTNGDDQLGRAGGIANDIAADAWGRVLTTNELADGSASTGDASSWVEVMKGLHVENIQNAAKQRNAGGKDNHSGKFEINNINVHTTYENETAFFVTLTYESPERSEDVTFNITMRQVEGENGEKLWKAIAAKSALGN